MIKRRKIKYFFLFLIVMFASLWLLAQYRDVSGPGVPVLLYHGVDNSGSTNKYVIDVKVFEQQLNWLKNSGYSTILPRDIQKFASDSASVKTVMLTFDDGRIDNYEIVFPLLKKYGFSAVFFVVTGAIDTTGVITSKQLQEMSASGMEIGSHSISHPFLDTLEPAEVTHQLKQSKQILENITGETVTSIAPPGGWFDKEVVKIARKQGYSFLFSCEIGLNDVRNNPYVYKRIEVLRGISITDFTALLVPVRAFSYKLKQSLKFTLHSIIGTSNYVKLSHAI